MDLMLLLAEPNHSPIWKGAFLSAVRESVLDCAIREHYLSAAIRMMFFYKNQKEKNEEISLQLQK